MQFLVSIRQISGLYHYPLPSSIHPPIQFIHRQVCKARYPNNAPKEIVAAVHGPRCGCHVGTLPEVRVVVGGFKGVKVKGGREVKFLEMLPSFFFSNFYGNKETSQVNR